MMTQGEILLMARQVGYTPFEALKWEQALTDFAKLVAEAEREACAKICDELSKKHSWEGCYANECAEAIRSRGAT
jgi:sugar phosphate isomerase/epimerase